MWLWRQSRCLRGTVLLLGLWAWPALRHDSYERGEWCLTLFWLVITQLVLRWWERQTETDDVDKIGHDSR
jgi:hypothetical protein